MKKDLRNFGILLGFILAGLGIFKYFNNQPNSIYYLITSLVFLLPALVYPQMLRLPYKLWMKLADGLGFIMTRVILITLFYLVITPISLILKLTKKDLLNLKLEPNKKSYWLKKSSKLDKASLLKQY